VMHGHEKSDSVIVAMKPTNKTEQPAAEQSAVAPTATEPVEPRTGTKGNASQQSTYRAQNRASVTQALDRIRNRARAQQPAMRTIVWLYLGWEDDDIRPIVGAFRSGLAGLGYTESKNIRLLYRYAHGHAYRSSLLRASWFRSVD
jgi:hypothetical protein